MPPFVVEAAAIFTADHYRAAVGTLQEAGDVQQCRLAGTRWPHQRYDLAGPQDQVDPVQHHELGSGLLEDAPDPAQLERWRERHRRAHS